MRSLNYLEIRTNVRSGVYSIDLNKNLYSHPFYSCLTISEIDHGVKNLAFMGHFLKISSSSANPANNELLQSLKEINVCVILNPSKPYEPIQNLSKTKKFISKCKNYLRHRPRVVIKPYQTLVLPITISFIHGSTIPELSLQLLPELSSKGLICSGIFPSNTKEEVTYVSIHNSSSHKLSINDLDTLGTISIIQR